jgi:threonine synthase
VRYISTRGETPGLGFIDAMLAGLAGDGGLYVPQSWPIFAPAAIAAWSGRRYPDVAAEILQAFMGPDLAAADLARLTQEAALPFRHPAVTPLVQLGPRTFVLELFHGPTLAFKDLAMQLLGRLIDHALKQRARRATIVAATSGDTGGAAVEAFRGRDQVDVVVLYPHGRISEVQRRMMTTVPDANVHAVAITGTFDDCQALVKGLFAHRRFRDRVRLSAVNSINWARIAAQTVYYAVAAVALGAPQRRVAFAVPTGNFGDAFAGYAAMRMGLPVARLTVATNLNDILVRTLATGRYAVREVVATASPSMDIQVASNFERLLFEAYDRDAEAVRALMGGLAQSRHFVIAPAALAAIRAHFTARRADEEETAATMRTVRREAGYLLDPHGAVAFAGAEKDGAEPGTPIIVLATAHPAKFPDAVERATGIRPALPDWLAELPHRPERVTVLPVDQPAVEQFIVDASRAAREGAAAWV